ncbi:MAG: dienelactone hydrolase family protein [Myxococcota bacterium]
MGMVARLESITIPWGEGQTQPGVLAQPEGAAPGDRLPAVVVIHDITGFRDDTHRHCRRFAEAGYVAIAPDLYGGGAVGCIVSTLTSMGRGRGWAYTIIRAARARLAKRPEVAAERIGITGFCMGGEFALLSAADDAYAVAAPFYGFVPRKAERLEGICPTIGQFGAQDIMLWGHASRLSKHLKALGVEHDVLVHEGVGHSFMNNHTDPLFALAAYTPMRGGYDAATEAKAWDAMLAFFNAHLPT